MVVNLSPKCWIDGLTKIRSYLISQGLENLQIMRILSLLMEASAMNA